MATAPFRTGDRMDQRTFHALYLTTPHGFRAELIRGVVHLTPRVAIPHGRTHARAQLWIGEYVDGTLGTEAMTKVTTVLGPDSEVEPDVSLYIDPECGGRGKFDAGGYALGGPELVVEVTDAGAVELGDKKADYEDTGVLEYVVARTDSETVTWFTRDACRFVELRAGGDGIYRSRVFPGLWLDPTTLFEVVPRRIHTVLRDGRATPEHAAFVAKLEAARAKTKANGKRKGTK